MKEVWCLWTGTSIIPLRNWKLLVQITLYSNTKYSYPAILIQPTEISALRVCYWQTTTTRVCLGTGWGKQGRLVHELYRDNPLALSGYDYLKDCLLDCNCTTHPVTGTHIAVLLCRRYQVYENCDNCMFPGHFTHLMCISTIIQQQQRWQSQQQQLSLPSIR